MSRRQRIAVVGAGVSGLTAAWILARAHDVTLYEAAPRVGGPAEQVSVRVDGKSYDIETGLLLYQPDASPLFVALLRSLGLHGEAVELSCALAGETTEWCGHSLAGLFADPRNLARPAFLRLLADAARLRRACASAAPGAVTVGEFLRAQGYARAFIDDFLLPRASGWFRPAATVLDVPFARFAEFARSVDLLHAFGRPAWRSLPGGGREYAKRLVAQLGDVRPGCPVRAVRRRGGRVWVRSDEDEQVFDQVVLACHPDQARRLLGEDATRDEAELLGAIRYAPVRSVLHTDVSLLPRRRALWAAWNYRAAAGAAPGVGTVSWLLNRIQPLPFAAPLLLSLNPQQAPAAASVIRERFHRLPLLDAAGLAAQRRLSGIMGRGGVWFCGAWNGFGLHEDGVRSALRVVDALGCRAPWEAPRTPYNNTLSMPPLLARAT